jgi:xylitol oxidase
MEKRTFLKYSSALIGGAVFSPLLSWQQREKLMNWAGNIQYGTDQLYIPGSVEQVTAFIKQHSNLKVLGTRHCFNRIADSNQNLISLKSLNQVIELDPNKRRVTIQAGVTYGQLGPFLHDKGFALHNLASLPHISVVGACITGTHGSGVTNGNLSTAVAAIEMITAEGDLVSLTREKDGEEFLGAVVNLGALGVITQLTLEIQPTYMVRQDVYENLPLHQLQNHFDEILSSGYSVSLFTDWQTESFSELWIKTRVIKESAFILGTEFFGAKAATRNLHPIEQLSAENCTAQMGVPGPWYDRLPHFRMGFTPSSGKELQTEYFVPYHHGQEAILAVFRLAKLLGPQLQISEIRTIAADNLWMSPCFEQPSMTIHFTWKPNWPEVRKLIPLVEKELEPFLPRPHWGKLFTLEVSKIRSRYVHLAAFQKLAMHYDPKGKFRNAFLNQQLFES